MIFSFFLMNWGMLKRAYWVRALFFSVKPQSIEYSEFLLPFELLFRYLKQEILCNEDLPLIKARLLDTALSSFQSFSSDQSPSENSTASKSKVLRHLSKNKNIFILKADMGNTIVILDKIFYISVIEEILNDHTKRFNLDIPTGKEINYITNLKKRITSYLKLLKGKETIDMAIHKNIKQVGSRPGVLYGLWKVQKETRMDYQLSVRFCQLLVHYLKSNKTFTTIFDTFYIPLDKTSDIWLNNWYDENTPNISKDLFHNLIVVATKKLFFIFNSKFYKQIDGVAMGSLLGPALANIFMCSFENKWLKDCHNCLTSVFYRQYVDDIFVLFKELLSSKQPNINFSLEKEKDGRLSILDINILREKWKFVTNVYRKRVVIGVYTNFDRFIPETWETGLIKSLLFQCFNLCSEVV